MGGNLFQLGRLPRKDYLIIEKLISNYLNTKIGAHNYLIPRYYNDKIDFGDLDVLINSSKIEDWKTLKTEIVSDLQVTKHKSVGNIFSTVFHNFQVDFFIKSEPYFFSTYNFMCFNDVGNIIGRMFRQFNLKYGEKGLLYVYRRESQESYSKDIEISKDFEKMITFLELDYQAWLVGFPNKKELFNWVTASPFFSTKPYLDVNKAIQKRKQRPTIMAFISYLKANSIEKSPEYLSKKDYIPIIDNYFPEAELLDKIKREEEREAFVNSIRAKYNGRIIMDLFPELKGKALGGFMTYFQSQFIDYENTLYNAAAEDIITLLIKVKKEYDNRDT